MNPESKQKRIAFGYKRLSNDKIGIYEGQAAALQLIYIMYAEGKSLSEIKSVLEGMNVPSPYNGRSWGKQTLSNPNYLGSEEYPAIIASDLFETVQRIKAQRTCA